ncbi:MAG: hypothetical protein NTZ05_19065 [Chloroflexi bacterium]|nr:hypothetical protein [Chloroflexota bacterium]
MKLIRARSIPGRDLYEFGVWLDEERTVPGPQPEEGVESAEALIPDPDWVCGRVWMVEPHPGQSDEEYQAAVVLGLAAEEWRPELERRRMQAFDEGDGQEADADAPVALALEGMALDLVE